ncbi:MAG: cysteine desulfurase [Cyanobacteria bacterium P01_H01_bin.74]
MSQSTLNRQTASDDQSEERMPVFQSLTAERVQAIRGDFPVLAQQVNGKPLAYLDNAATTQKPHVVIDKMYEYFSTQNGTVRRGVYHLSEISTREYDLARAKFAKFINAPSPKEIVITKGATESVNLVASSYGQQVVKSGDAVLVSGLEHHANLVPWQQLCLMQNATLLKIPVLDDGTLDQDAYDTLLNTHDNIKILAVNHVSNALGTINPIHSMIAKAHEKGIVVVVDGAQSTPHMPVDVQALDCDFYISSGHKMYGPTGVGLLYGKMDLLDAMPPYQLGGDMIRTVSFEKTTFAPPPARFEAGTPAIAEVIGLGSAIDYIESIGVSTIDAYEKELLHYATEQLNALPEVTIIGTAPEKAAIVSFKVEGVHPHDIGTLLDQEGIALRAGHHCAQPVMDRFSVPATARISLSFYNTTEEIDALVVGIKKIVKLFK